MQKLCVLFLRLCVCVCFCLSLSWMQKGKEKMIDKIDGCEEWGGGGDPGVLRCYLGSRDLPMGFEKCTLSLTII